MHLARSHYENFPVASWLVPRRLRQPVAAIYAFARTADDLADEGSNDSQQRLEQLQHYRQQLQSLDRQTTPIFVALNDTHQRFNLPLSLFDDLLTAFIQDVYKTRYQTRSEVLDYCRHSANPVGRLMLHLYDAASEHNLSQSDAICTSLQLINFLQDIEQDYQENNRIYIPIETMQDFGLNETWISERITNTQVRELITMLIDQARTLMLSGAPLAWRLQGRFGLEIRFIVAGGLCILNKLTAQQDDVFSRPRLNRSDKWWMLRTAFSRLSPQPNPL